ncbi:mucin-5AC-like [Sarcophilus harrisii]
MASCPLGSQDAPGRGSGARRESVAQGQRPGSPALPASSGGPPSRAGPHVRGSPRGGARAACSREGGGAGGGASRSAWPPPAYSPSHNGQVCSTWGDFHYKTFDGDIFHFPGLCNYVFSSHCKSPYEDFNVQIRRSPGPNATTAVSRVTLKLEGTVLEMSLGAILVNGKPAQLPFSQAGILIEKSSTYVRVVAKLGLVFLWNQDDGILLELDAKYANQTCGLCGDFNGVPTYNEFFSNNVRLTAAQFGNMQKLDGPTEQCQDPLPAAPHNCMDPFDICETVLRSAPFFACHALVDVGSYVEACRQDACGCDEGQRAACICGTVAEYSRQCAHAGGLPADWRAPELCPKTCPGNMQYRECGSPCVDTCSNHEQSPLCEEHCVDGCFCPPGTVFDDISGQGCVPVNRCFCTYKGQPYAPGAFYSTECTNCTCSGGQWSCQDLPCPGTCSVTGGSHFSTFDEKHYTVHGDCNYVLVKPCDDKAFTVLTELRKCGLTDSETCLKSVSLSIGQTVIVVKSTGEVFVNRIYTQLPVSAGNATLFRPSSSFIIAQTNLGLQLTIQLSPIMQVFVRLEPSLQGLTCGLCGNFNNVQADDFRTMSGVVEGTAAAFVNTYKTQADCPNVKNHFEDPCTLSVENEKYAQHWCGLLTDRQGPFALCHAVVSPALYHRNRRRHSKHAIFHTRILVLTLILVLVLVLLLALALTLSLVLILALALTLSLVLILAMALVLTLILVLVLVLILAPALILTLVLILALALTLSLVLILALALALALTLILILVLVLVLILALTLVLILALPLTLFLVLILALALALTLILVLALTLILILVLSLALVLVLTLALSLALEHFYSHPNCMFDTCNCEKSEDCLCAALSSYVQACAAQGVLLSGWRTGVCTKSMSCPKSLMYHYHITTCQPTCRSLSEPDVTCGIKFVPVDGCACQEGTFMDDTGKCVPLASCPCYYQGSALPNGESVHDNGVICTCTQGRLNCIGGQVPKPVCTAPMVYFDCRNASAGATGAECQKSCHTLDMACYNSQCVSGCVCPDGLVSDGEGGCIHKDQCPCVHNEANYQPGETIQVECNTCTCKNRMWECTKEPCLGTCAVYGDGHYITFDGQRYSFSGNCEYTLVQDHCGKNSSGKGTFRVITENIPCGTTGTTCSKAIKIFLGSYELKLSEGKVEAMEKEGAKGEPPYSIRQMGIYLIVDTNAGLVLLWDKKTSIFIQLSQDFKGKVCGLCGNYDGNTVNDFTTRSLSVVGDVWEFGNSWKLSPTCPDTVPVRDPCTANPYRKAWAQKQCSIINSAVFSACHPHVEPTKYYEACVSDACACDTGGDCECFCTAVAAYAQACNEISICVSWRTPSICPLFCDYYNPNGSCEWHYQPCGAPCMKTCHNPSGKCSHNVRGLEGCYPKCPPEAPIFDEDKMECVQSCAPCYIRGRYYPPGSPVPSDENCHSCSCTEAGIKCTYDSKACVCTYEGRSFHPGEIIYHTTDGTGGCITATCSANGTIVGKVYDCDLTTTAPSTTFSFSHTTLGANSGDFDTLENIRAEGYRVCSSPRGVECRAAEFPAVPWQELNQTVECSTTQGLICHNKDQASGKCENYQIRILCCASQPCEPSTVRAPTTEPHSQSTVTPAISTSSPSTTPEPGSHSTKTTASPTTTKENETRESHSSSPKTSENSSHSPKVTSSKVRRVSVTNPCLQEICEWTAWIDGSYPSPDINGGDFDTFKNLRSEGYQFCDVPTEVECRAKSFPNIPLKELEQNVTCSKTEGLVCLNKDQLPPICYNYEIRIKCCWKENVCGPKVETTSRAYTTQTPKSHGVTKITTGQKPTVKATCQPQCSWTKWFDVDFPSSAPSGGDEETYNNIMARGEKICHKPEYITELECRAESHPKISINETGQVVECNPDYGLICRNQDQKGKFKMCLNYEIRVLCCEPMDNSKSRDNFPFCAHHNHFTSNFTPNSNDLGYNISNDSHDHIGHYKAKSRDNFSFCAHHNHFTSNFTPNSNDLGYNISNNSHDHIGHYKAKSRDNFPFCAHHNHLTSNFTPNSNDLGYNISNDSHDHIGHYKAKSRDNFPFCAHHNHLTFNFTPNSNDLGYNISNDSHDHIGHYKAKSRDNFPFCAHHNHLTSNFTPNSNDFRYDISNDSHDHIGHYKANCEPQCSWTKWFDVDFPSSAPSGGDMETYNNIIRGGEKICKKTDYITRLQCRAQNHPHVNIEKIGQVVECNPDYGLICKNQDQKGKFKMCFNYEIRVLCCEPKINCSTTTATTPTIPTTIFVTTKSSPETTSHSVPTTTTSPSSSPQTPTTSVTTSPTTPTTTSVTTKPSPKATSHSVPTTTTSTPASPQTPTTSVSTTPTIPSTSTYPPTYSCELQCSWTKWFDVDFPSSGPNGGDEETYNNIMARGEKICHKPEYITELECRSESHPEISINETGQVVECNPDYGLICRNQDQKGKFKMCFNYEIRVLCCEPINCPITTTTSPTTPTTTSVTTKPSPKATSHSVPTTTTSTPSSPQTPTTSVSTPTTPSTSTYPPTYSCELQCSWTKWFDVDFPSSGPNGGDEETYNNIMARGEKICHKPEYITELECRSESHPEISINETGQVVECNPDYGLICRNQDQKGKFKMCFNYEIRVLCCEPINCPITTTTSPTTPMTTSVTTKPSPETTSHSVPTTTTSTPSSPQTPTTSVTTSPTTPTTTSVTTKPSPKATSHSVPTTTTSTPSSPQTPTTSVSTTPTTTPSTSTHPPIPSCEPQCSWTKWFDVDFPSSGPNGGDEETYNNIMARGEKICHKPEYITELECRSESHPEISINETGQVVECNPDYGLICKNQDQKGKFKMCFNYEIRVLCCEPINCPITTTTSPTTPTTTSVTTKPSPKATSHSVPTTTTSTPSSPQTPTTSVSTPTTPSTSTYPPTYSCELQCLWTKWFDVDFPSSGPNGGDEETYNNIMARGEKICHKPEYITELECRSESHPEISINETGQVVECNPDYGLICRNQDQKGKFKMCFNYEIRVLCCEPINCPITTTTSPTTPTTTLVTTKPSPETTSHSVPTTTTSTPSSPQTPTTSVTTSPTTPTTTSVTTKPSPKATSHSVPTTTTSTPSSPQTPTTSVSTTPTTTPSTSTHPPIPSCEPQCSWTKWFDVDFPSSGPNGGDEETYNNIMARGEKICHKPEYITELECRSESHPEISINETGQVVECNPDYGLICKNQDQKGKFKMCFNYEIRVLCCEPINCPITTTTSPTTPTTTSVTTKPSPETTSHSVPTTTTSTPSSPQTPTTSVSTTPTTTPSTSTHPPIPSCEPQCSWTKWFDVDFPSSGPNGGDEETYNNIMARGEKICHKPEYITELECRSESHPEISINETGQVVECNPDYGLICRNQDQKGKFKMCFNYEIRVLCCEPINCPITTTTSPTTPTTTSVTTKPSPETISHSVPTTTTSTPSSPQTPTTSVTTSPTTPTTTSVTTKPSPKATSHSVPTTTTSTPSSPQTPTTSVSTTPTTTPSTSTHPPTPSCEPQCSWTKWFDVDFPSSGPNGGDEETYNNIMARGEKICHKPEYITELECRSESHPEISINETGQVVECNPDYGLICKNQDQKGKFKMCFNYEIRVLCCEPINCPITTTTSPTTPTTTSVTTKPSPETTSHSVPTTTTSTPSSPQTPTTSVSTTPTTTPSTSTHPPIPSCEPQCSWTKWFDVDFPSSGPNGGDEETYNNIMARGEKICHKPEYITELECRSESHPEISINETGQVVECNPDYGLICKNQDQTGKFKMCFNYEIRVLCCEPINCPITTTTSPTTPTTTSVTTKPSPETTSHSVPTTTTSTPSSPQTPTTSVSTTPTTTPSTSTHPPIPSCEPQCSWTKWFDVDFPSSGPNGGDEETYNNIMARGEKICHKPEYITELECRSESHPEISINETGQVVECNPDYGLICRNQDQKGKFKMCFNYEIRVLCCEPINCPITTTTSPTTPTTTSVTTKPSPETTSHSVPTTTTSTPSSPQTPTTSVSTTPTTTPSTSTHPPIPSCEPQCSWTKWFDVDFPSSGPNGGDEETYNNIMARGEKICHKPEYITELECRSESHPEISINETGQVVECNPDYGLICRNQDQKGKFKMCFNYEIRVLCCEPINCPITTTTSPTTPTTTSVTTKPSPETASHSVPTTTTSTPSSPQTPTTSVSTTPTTTPSTSTHPPIPSCEPQCSWTKWFDVDFPSSGPNGGDEETYNNIMARGEKICHKPEYITELECRSESHPEISINETGQVVECNPDYGLICRNQDQKGKFKMCFNYEIRVLCCEPINCPITTTTSPTTPTTTSVTTKPSPETTSHSVPTTTTSTPSSPQTPTTSVTTSPTTPTTTSVTTKPSPKATSHSVPTTTTSTPSSPQTPTTSVSTTPTTTPSTSTHPPIPSCEPQCSWTKWFDVDFPSSGPNGGDEETYNNIMARGEKICHKPEYITELECRSESHPEISINETGQVVECNPDYGLICKNQDQKGKFKMCFNYEIRVLCCEPINCPITTTTSPTTPTTTSVTTKPSPETTSHSVPTTTTSTPSSPQTPTTSVSTTPTTTPSTSTHPPIPSCEPQCSWTKWFDVDFPSSGPNGGDEETYNNIMARGEKICHKPEYITELECRSESHPEISINETGQVVECNPDYGLICKNQDQKGKFKMCFNYEIRVLCCEPINCPITTTTSPTTPTTTSVTTKPSPETTSHSVPTTTTSTPSSPQTPTTSVTTSPTTPTTTSVTTKPSPETTSHSVPTTTTSTPSSPQTPTTSVTTSPTTPTTTSVTTKPSPETTSHSVPTTTTSTPSSPQTPTTSVTTSPTTPTTTSVTTKPSPETTSHSVPTTTTSTPTSPQTPTTSVSTTPTTTPSTSTHPPTPSCEPQCSWTKWFDVDFPSSGPNGGDEETYNNIMARGEKICHKPEYITELECRSESHPEISINETGQVVECNPDYGLICKNQDQKGKFKMCFNYEIRVLCCEPMDNCPSTMPSSSLSPTIPTKTSATTFLPSSKIPPFHVSTTFSTLSPPSSSSCYCFLSGKVYPSGTVIYNQTDNAGHCYSAICNRDCSVERIVESCPTVAPTPSPSTSASTTTAIDTSATTSTSPSHGCLNAEPPRQKGETWFIHKCKKATCEGDDVITLTPVSCPPVKELSCTNGYPPVKVYDDADHCCYHYECQCVCSGWGDPHYITFDGIYYTFLDNCTYVLVQQIHPVYDHFRVLIDNYFCDAQDGLSCPRSITVEYKDNRIVLIRTLVRGMMENEIIFNNRTVSAGFKKDGIVISTLGIKMFVTIPELGVQVMFSGMLFSVEVPFTKFANNTEGQCGTCTNDKRDECRLPDGKVVSSCSAMSSSWKYHVPDQPYCAGPPPTPPAPSLTTSKPCPPSLLCMLIMSKVFEACHHVIPPEPYFEACVYDQCRVPDSLVWCSSLELYASLCAAQGVCIDWRGETQGQCALTCPDGQVYQACGPTNPPTCQSPQGSLNSNLTLPGNISILTEGCFCPTGTTMFSFESKVCVPATPSECHSWCTGPNGEPVRPGAKVPSDPCEICSCVCDDNPESKTSAILCQPIVCDTHCPMGYKYQEEPGHCCGKCVQVACVVHTNSSGVHTNSSGVQLVQPGQTWSNPEDKCVQYECEKVNGQLILVTAKKACPPVLCSPDQVRKSEDGCCLVCPPPPQVYPCAVGRHTQVIRKGSCSSPTPVEVTYCQGNCGDTMSMNGHDEPQSGCSDRARAPPAVSSPTAPIPTRKLREGLAAQRGTRPRGFADPRSGAPCAPLARRERGAGAGEPRPRLTPLALPGSYSFESNALEHRCRCCRELSTSRRNVTLRCPDGSSLAFAFSQVEECGCQRLRCDQPDGGSGESEESGDNEEEPARSQERGPAAQQSLRRPGAAPAAQRPR